jgi:hypothetical protein
MSDVFQAIRAHGRRGPSARRATLNRLLGTPHGLVAWRHAYATLRALRPCRLVPPRDGIPSCV